MGKCEWCGKQVGELLNYTDALGDVHFICKDCMKSVDGCECRKCSATVDTSMMINGLCTNCIQAELMVKSKKREEARIGVDKGFIDTVSSELTLTDQDYERWMTLGKSFSPADMKNSRELRRMWVMVKFNAAGIYDGETISKHSPDIEKLLDRNFSKLVGNKCRILIANTAETRKIVRQYEVIDYENEAYILKA